MISGVAIAYDHLSVTGGGDIFTLCLVFQCSLQVSNYNEVAFLLFFLNPQHTNKVYKSLSDSKMFCFSTRHVEKVRLIIESPIYVQDPGNSFYSE